MSKTLFVIRKSPVSKATVETSMDDRLRGNDCPIPDFFCARFVLWL